MRQQVHNAQRCEQLDYYAQNEELAKQIIGRCRQTHEEYLELRVLMGRMGLGVNGKVYPMANAGGLDSGRASVSSELHSGEEK